MNQILTEKYRPKTVSDLVYINDEYENKFKTWIANKTIDSHLIFYGPPGTGKSSSINVLINELQLTDYIRYNMSDKTSIDDMRKVIDYASVPPLEKDTVKLIILEEFERASKQAQSSLKYVLEEYSNWCRFIFTTNNIAQIDVAITSRCQRYHFNTLKFEEFVGRIAKILQDERIIVNDMNDVVKYVEIYQPDLRACINAIDQNTINNILQPLKNDAAYAYDKFSEVINNINNDCFTLKKLLAQNIANEEYESLYQFMYNHLSMITTEEKLYDDILIIIAKYLYQHNFVAFPDINFISCIIEIKKIIGKYSF